MDAASTAQRAQPTPQSPSSPPSRHRRPRQQRDQSGATAEDTGPSHLPSSRGGRGRRPRNAALNPRPATVTPASRPASANLSSAENSATESNIKRSVGSSGRGRGNHAISRTVNGRQFGGQLTQDYSTGHALAGPVATSLSQLQADAATFIPGQIRTQSQRQKQPLRTPRQQKRRTSKSSAPDIATRIHEDIDRGYYECPICTNEIQRSSKIWSSICCWTVFHLTCIKKWSSNDGSALAQQNPHIEDRSPPRQWRCPGCNSPQDLLPKTYTCWCEKEVEPRSLPGLPPHSCGQTCGKERARECPHRCQEVCHSGPCPPCTQMGPSQVCFCGKHEITKRCIETSYNVGFGCGEPCGEIMPCGEHNHEANCHEGLCGGCEELIDARCYCGQVERQISCQDRGTEKESCQTTTHKDDIRTERWTGTFECDKLCKRPFDCGIHLCERKCHARVAQAEHCPRSPFIVSSCPCGKTELSEITHKPRETCSDPIPSCKKPCARTLPCGHSCKTQCHAHTCPPCMETVEINCRCGRTTSKSICHQGTIEPPQCMRICRATLNCGRHNCDERCCPSERKTAERQSSRRKQRPLNSAPRVAEDGIEPEHICMRTCGRPLKCGNHDCDSLCHKGPCASCREAIFQDISCHCGRTVLDPPLPCGTQPPPCRFPCNRPTSCGHPQVPHNCHQDDESCPKCPFLVSRSCMDGKKTLKNQPCWLQDASCGEVCGKKLRCGSHFCRKTCHKNGECEDAGGKQCLQACGKPKKVCGHPDEAPCHSPFACKEDKPCPSKIWVTCDCQAQKQEMRCNASKASEGNTTKALPCNDECARLERNRKLALALNIDQSSHVEGGDHIPYSSESLSMFAEHVKWGQVQEREFRVFATSDDEKRLRFKPMTAQQRAFVHALAEDFGFDSESMDPEPHRHVLLMKTPRFVSAPRKTLAEALRIRQAQRAAVGSLSDTETTKQSKSNEANLPFNSFVISSPRFGLTMDEVRTELAAVVHPVTPITFEIDFLLSDAVLLKAASRTLSEQEVQHQLQALKPALAAAFSAKAYGGLQLCHADASLNITSRESDSGGDGWSRVAAKGAAPRRLVPQAGVGGHNAFSALSGSKVTFTRKRPDKIASLREVSVVEDWETAEREAEQREKVAGSGEEGTRLELQEPRELGVASVTDDATEPPVLGVPAEHDAPVHVAPAEPGDSEPHEGGTRATWADEAEAADD